MVTKKIVGSKSILKKVLVFLVMSVSFLSLSSQDVFGKATNEKSRLIKNIKEIRDNSYYRGDFYSDVVTYPKEMVSVVMERTKYYMIPFAHYGMGTIEETTEEFINKVGGSIIECLVTPPPFGQGEPYYCVDIYDRAGREIIASMTIGLDIKKTKNGYLVTPAQDLEISYKGKVYRNLEAVEFLHRD